MGGNHPGAPHHWLAAGPGAGHTHRLPDGGVRLDWGWGGGRDGAGWVPEAWASRRAGRPAHQGWGDRGMGDDGVVRTRFSTAARSRNFCAASSSSRSGGKESGRRTGSEGPGLPLPPPNHLSPTPGPRVLPGDTVFSRMVISSMAEVVAATPPKMTVLVLGRRLHWGWGLGVGWEGRVGWGARVTTSPFTGSLLVVAPALSFLPPS